MPTATLEKTLSQIENHHGDVAANFADAARMAADGEEFSAKELRAIIEAAGKTPNDFRERVQLHQHRQQLRDDIERHFNLSQQHTVKRAEVAAMKEKHKEIIEQLKAELKPLEDAVLNLSSEMSRINPGIIRRELENTCPVEGLREKRDKAQKAIQDMSASYSDAENQVGIATFELNQAVGSVKVEHEMSAKESERIEAAKVALEAAKKKRDALKEKQERHINARSEAVEAATSW